MWLVEFYTPWSSRCIKLASTLEKAAKALEGEVKVGAVNLDTDLSVSEPYDIKVNPTLKFFGFDKTMPKPFTIDTRKATKGLIVNEALASKSTEESLRDKV